MTNHDIMQSMKQPQRRTKDVVELPRPKGKMLPCLPMAHGYVEDEEAEMRTPKAKARDVESGSGGTERGRKMGADVSLYSPSYLYPSTVYG